MKFLIALLTAATGILHLLVGFNLVAGMGSINWLLVANGVGYLVLLALFFTSSGSRRGAIRWILLLYTLITLVGYFVIRYFNGQGLFDGGTIPLVIKAIELLLIILLFLDRGSDRVVTPAPATSTTRMGAGYVPPTPGAVSGAAVAAAGGAAALGDRSVVAANEAMATAGDVVVDTADTTGDAWDATTDTVADAADYVGDTAEAAWDATTDTVSDAAVGMAAAGAAAGYVSDRTEEAWDATTDMAEETAGMTADMVDDTTTWVGETAEEMESVEPSVEELRAELEDYLLSFGPTSEFRKPVEYIEGIGDAFGQKLRGMGIVTVLDLIVNGATRRGRKQISEQSGISQSLILTWVNHVDLFRIKGIAQQYAELLEESGVDTVVELAQRNPQNLHKRMIDLNEQQGLVRRTPHLSEVEDWVQQAKGLRRLIYY
jgi:hypothetical protein